MSQNADDGEGGRAAGREEMDTEREPALLKERTQSCKIMLLFITRKESRQRFAEGVREETVPIS